jgi:hypothetical protein
LQNKTLPAVDTLDFGAKVAVSEVDELHMYLSLFGPVRLSGQRQRVASEAPGAQTSHYGTVTVDGEGPFGGKGYFFRGDRYIRFDYGDDLLDPGYPRLIADEWHGLPSEFTGGLDAAFNGQRRFAGKLYFFKGDRYVRYDWATDRADPGYPKLISDEWHGLPTNFETGIDAAVTGKGHLTGKAFFFKGNQCVRYDWETDRADPGYPRLISDEWHGLPTNFETGIQAAMNGQKGSEGKLYLFNGSDYVRYDWAEDRADPGYPKSIAFYWVGPGPSERDPSGLFLPPTHTAAGHGIGRATPSGRSHQRI